MHARVAYVGELTWDVSASQVREIRYKEPSYALLSLFLRDIRAVPAIDGPGKRLPDD